MARQGVPRQIMLSNSSLPGQSFNKAWSNVIASTEVSDYSVLDKEYVGNS